MTRLIVIALLGLSGLFAASSAHAHAQSTSFLVIDVAEGDTVVAHFDAQGTARDGKPYVNSYAWILTLKDGRIVRAHAFFDAHAFDDFWTRVRPAE